MSRGVCENLSHGGVLFPITKCKYGSNFNFTCIKIRNLLVTQLTEEKTKKRKKEARHCGIRKDRAGLLPSRSGEEGSVGISWKAISSSWVVAAKKTFSPLSTLTAVPPRLALAESRVKTKARN